MKTRIRGSEQVGFGHLVFAVVIVVIGLGLCVWFFSLRAGRNDHLQREARFLSGSLRRWKQQAATNVAPELASYTVNNRSGTVIRVNEKFVVAGHEQTMELGWTNSCLGPGTLIVTSSNVFLWREPGGETRKLNIPNLSRIPFWWYLTNP